VADETTQKSRMSIKERKAMWRGGKDDGIGGSASTSNRYQKMVEKKKKNRPAELAKQVSDYGES